MPLEAIISGDIVMPAIEPSSGSGDIAEVIVDVSNEAICVPFP